MYSTYFRACTQPKQIVHHCNHLRNKQSLEKQIPDILTVMLLALKNFQIVFHYFVISNACFLGFGLFGLWNCYVSIIKRSLRSLFFRSFSLNKFDKKVVSLNGCHLRMLSPENIVSWEYCQLKKLALEKNVTWE